MKVFIGWGYSKTNEDAVVNCGEYQTVEQAEKAVADAGLVLAEVETEFREGTSDAVKLEWNQLWDAMDAKPSEWIETTEDMYWHMLECVPPRSFRRGAFLVGEAKCHNSDGEAVHACFVQRGEKFFAKHLTVAQFNEV